MALNYEQIWKKKPSTPKVLKVQKSIWECFFLDPTRNDIVTSVKVQEEMELKVQKTEVYTAINSGAVLIQGTFHITKWNLRRINPVQRTFWC